MVCMDIVTAPLAGKQTGELHARSVRPVSGKVDKRSLARRYQVGIRTVENWQSRGIIRAGREHGEAVFDVLDCDNRLLIYRQ